MTHIVEFPSCVSCDSTDVFRCRLCGVWCCRDHISIVESIGTDNMDSELECIHDPDELGTPLEDTGWDVSGPVLSPRDLAMPGLREPGVRGSDRWDRTRA